MDRDEFNWCLDELVDMALGSTDGLSVRDLVEVLEDRVRSLKDGSGGDPLGGPPNAPRIS